MKSKVFILLLIPSGLFAQFLQWEKWQPWATELGISPYVQIEYRVATPESLLNYINVEKGGTNLKLAMQTCLPPFYLQWGFSNIMNVILMPSRLAEDTVLSPLYMNWRGGIQLFYEERVTYNVSISFVKAIATGDLGFTSVLLENVCAMQFPLALGKLQVMGNIGGGMTSEFLSIYDKIVERDNSILNFSLGVFWWTSYVAPYLYTGVTYPMDEEETKLQYFFSLGVQFVLPRVLLKGIPDVSHPQCYTLIREE